MRAGHFDVVRFPRNPREAVRPLRRRLCEADVIHVLALREMCEHKGILQEF